MKKDKNKNENVECFTLLSSNDSSDAIPAFMLCMVEHTLSKSIMYVYMKYKGHSLHNVCPHIYFYAFIKIR